MTESDVTRLARIYSLVAETESIKAYIEAMKVANVERESHGKSTAYSEDHFHEESEKLTGISKELFDLV